ncbi:hypothetical protein ACIHEJ_19205 [Streptomyces sp. NPDC052301]|uniref:hypothetical protein n=1 Tax=Streptomyces sp. NPDC052301 TaxID=3365687 RepID=UPI0037D52F6F
MNAVQLPAAGLLWWVWTTSQDQYESGYGGAWGIFCLLVFSPLLLPLLGLLVSAVLTLPAILLARPLLRWSGGPEWACRTLAAVATAIGWALVATVTLHRPFVTTSSVLTAFGLLPALGITYVRTRSWSAWGVWWRSALACAALFVLTIGGALAASATGLIPQYQPPELTPAQLSGVWRGEGGAELRLRRDGRAEAHGLPTESADGYWASPGDDAYKTCAGTGTWKPDPGTDDTGRPGILLHLTTDCGLETRWSISGTEDAPQLYAVFGDPDAGTLRTLERAGD